MPEAIVGEWAGFFSLMLSVNLPVRFGFLGKYASGDGVEPLAEELGCPLKLLQQVHGGRLVEESSIQRLADKADGFLFTIGNLLDHGLVIKTADCMPILMVGGKYGALIHSGWRGLASGIVKGAAQWLAQRETDFLTIIGPHASSARYQVGPEVWKAFGERACGCKFGDKYLLDMAGIAENEVHSMLPAATVKKFDICTISDARFHSHRRDGANSGRNLSFVTAG